MPDLATKLASLSIDTHGPSNAAELDLDSMFARLTQKVPAPASAVDKTSSSVKAEKVPYSFEDRVSIKYGLEEPTMIVKRGGSDSSVSPQAAHGEIEKVKTSPHDSKKADVKGDQDAISEVRDASEVSVKNSTTVQEGLSQEELETEYLRKASEYMDALPDSKGSSASTIRSVSKKLHSSYVPGVDLGSDEIKKLQARYAFAVVNYVNNVLKKGAKSLTTDYVKQVLRENDGNFFQLCATLVDEKYITLESLDEVVGLCKTILDVLPKPDAAVPAPGTKAISTKPDSTLSAWPAQEKRENRKYYLHPL